MKTNITKKIYIKPNLLNEHIRDNILKEVEESLVNKATKEYGIVLEICEICCINSSRIDSANNVSFMVDFVASCFVPIESDIVTAKVTDVYPVGILLSAYDIKIFIPVRYIDDLKFDTIRCSYSHSQGDIVPGINLDVELTEIRYAGKKYSGIARLIAFKD